MTGAQLIRALGQLGYLPTRQTGSHVRLTCVSPAHHHITVPVHDPLRIGTLAAILSAVAESRGLTRDELQQRLFG